MNTRNIAQYSAVLGLLLLLLAGSCIDTDEPICLPGNDCEIDAAIANGDTTEIIIQLLDGLGEFDFLGEPDTIYQCVQSKTCREWLNPLPGMEHRCDRPIQRTVIIGKDALLRDLNNFLYDGQLSSIIDLLPVDTCKCDADIYLMRAITPTDVDINNGVAEGTSSTRENNNGSILAAGFNYSISLDPVISTVLANNVDKNFPETCLDAEGKPQGNDDPQRDIKNPDVCIPIFSQQPSTPQSSVKVAIVDTGADPAFAYRGGKSTINNAFSTSLEMDVAGSSMIGFVPYGSAWPGNADDEDMNCFYNDYYGYDFLHDDNNPADKKGHGTHMTYTVLTANTSSNDNIRVLPLQFGGLDDNGNFGCDLFAGICAINYATKEESDIINLSWGFYSTIFHDVLFQQIKQAVNNDILVVTSAGNDTRWLDPDNCAHWPSGFSAVPEVSSSVISVAALAKFDVGGPLSLASYSNYGEKIDLAAPGTQVQGALAGSQNAMIPLDGTSMAAAVVSRRAAMLRYSSGSRIRASNLKIKILAETVKMKNACIGEQRALNINTDPSLLQAIGY